MSESEAEYMGATEDPVEFDQQRMDIPRARRTDRETSHEAAASVKDLTQVQRAILRCLYDGKPMCDFDLLVRYNGRSFDLPARYPRASDSGLRSRRAELERKGLVEDTGEKTKLPSGRRAVLFRITPAGQRIVDDER